MDCSFRSFRPWHWLRHHHHGRHQYIRVVLNLDGKFAVELSPEKETHFMAQADVGKPVTQTIEFLDKDGNVITAVPDSPPQWTLSDPNLASETTSADGLTNTVTGNAAGDEKVSLTVQVGGQTFTAEVTDSFVVPPPPPPQVASIRIVESVAA
jgi:hypothetical protein